MNLKKFFLLLWVIFAFLDPDSDPQPCLEGSLLQRQHKEKPKEKEMIPRGVIVVVLQRVHAHDCPISAHPINTNIYNYTYQRHFIVTVAPQYIY
jgi:hypothetical protein